MKVYLVMDNHYYSTKPIHSAYLSKKKAKEKSDELRLREYIWNPHKFWDLTICKNSSIIGFSIDYTMRQDHAGFVLEFDLFGWNIEYRFYDCRHWDDERNCWEERK